MTGLGLPSFTQLDWVDWAVTGYQGQCPALDWVDWVPSFTPALNWVDWVDWA